jgi:hypothetical protein
VLEDMFGGLGPHEGVGTVVPALDVGADLGVEVLDRAVDAAMDGLALDEGEPDLDPRSGRRT